jgi:glycosyltransferase involved in cell wall biosynthesis
MQAVLIDVTRLLGRLLKGRLPTGVDRVGLAYVQHYQQHSRAVIRLVERNFVLPKAESAQLFQWLLAPHGRFNALTIVIKGLLFGWNTQRVAGSFLINAGHSGMEKATYPSMLKRQQVRPLFVVHDLIPISYPEYCRAGERARHITRMSNALTAASGIIANSLATLNELTSFAASTGQAMPPSVVALLAPGMLGIFPGERPVVTPYFVMLSTIEPRKNHWMLLQIWLGLVERFGQAAPRLVVIGQRGWDCENVVDLLERCEQLKGFVIELHACSDAELVTYLHHAQALLFPSFAEGYGMPLVEALALGVPVIASDLPVFKEIAGSIPEYVDPMDGKRWSELIFEYANPDSQLRDAQLKRMADFHVPTWTAHFATVDGFLDTLKPEIAVNRVRSEAKL